MSSPYGNDVDVQPQRSVFMALKRIKDSGYRTIVICQSDPTISFQDIADAAEALGMNNGDYFFVHFDEFEPTIAFNGNANMSKFTIGSAWIMPPPWAYVDKEDMFPKVWNDQGSDIVDSLNSLNPIPEGSPGYIFAEPDYFQSIGAEYGSGKNPYLRSTAVVGRSHTHVHMHIVPVSPYV